MPPSISRDAETSELDELERRRDVDAAADAAIHRTSRVMVLVRAPRGILFVRRTILELVANTDALDDEHFLLDFDLALGIR